MTDLLVGDDGVVRCGWAGTDPLYVGYHDDEWGRGVADDRRLFEKIVLEGFQAGLAWITILRKRERFREVFAGFDPGVVARYGEREVASLLQDAGIVRHRGKIEAAISNAGAALDLIDEFGSIGAYVWPLADFDRPAPNGFADMPAATDVSTRLSKDLKRRGWRFVGPTTMYAFMQAMGLINDHLLECERRGPCEESRAAIAAKFVRS